jgi:hypothetical protein
MAVYQTRDYFIREFGFLTDNPKIGPLLAEHYWKPGNSINHDATLRSLTGEGFSASYLAEQCNLTSEEAWVIEQNKIQSMQGRKRSDIKPLNANIKLVDGDLTISSNNISDLQLCDTFESFINNKYFVK